MRTRRHSQGLALAATLLLGATAACGSGSTSSSRSAPDDAIVWAANADATGLDPQNNGQDASQNILSLVYEHLLSLDDGVQLQPQLAESYKQVSPTVYDFTLRSGVAFSNGRPLEAQDVVDSFTRILSEQEGSYLAGRLAAVKSVDATSPTTIRFTLNQPFAPFLGLLADPAAAILPMKEVKDGSFDPTKTLLGTGPYQLTSHQSGSSWTFTKNPHYWQPGLPKVPNLRVNIVGDQGTQIAALRGGSADIATFNSSETSGLLQGLSNVATKTQTSGTFYVLVLNELGRLKDLQTRQAINSAIDRSALASTAVAGQGVPVGPAPGLTDSCDLASLPFSQPDAARAKQLLEGRPASGTPYNLQYNTALPDTANLAQVIKTQLAAVGVDVTLQPLPNGQAVNNLVGGDFDMSLNFYASGTDPYVGLVDWSPTKSGFTAKFSAAVPAIEDKLPAVASGTRSERTQAIAQVCQAIDQDSGQIPLVSKPLLVAWNTTKLDADVLPAENASFPLRRIATYATK